MQSILDGTPFDYTSPALNPGRTGSDTTAMLNASSVASPSQIAATKSVANIPRLVLPSDSSSQPSQTTTLASSQPDVSSNSAPHSAGAQLSNNALTNSLFTFTFRQNSTPASKSTDSKSSVQPSLPVRQEQIPADRIEETSWNRIQPDPLTHPVLSTRSASEASPSHTDSHLVPSPSNSPFERPEVDFRQALHNGAPLLLPTADPALTDVSDDELNNRHSRDKEDAH